MRKIAMLLGALGCTVALAVPAGAAVVTPVSGTITCGITGTMKFNRPLANTTTDPGPARTRVTLTATMSNCNTSKVTGGRTTITGGTVTASGFLPEYSGCGDLLGGYPPDFTFDANRFSAAWTGTNATGKGKVAVGRSNSSVNSADAIFGGWIYETDVFGAKDAFAGEAAKVRLYPDDPSLVDACVEGEAGADGKPANLATVGFSTSRGSRISVQPVQ